GQEILRFVLDARARSDERHVAAQDVDQLRQLIEARLAEPVATARDRVAAIELVDAVVRLGRPGIHRLPDVLLVHRGVDVDLHRAELQRGELAAALPQARLLEEDRATRVALHAPCDVEEERGGQDEPHERAEDVDRPLDERRGTRQAWGREVDDRHAFERVDLDARADELVEPRDDVDLYVELA